MKNIFLFSLLVFLFSSCATVFSGTKCTVRVKDGVPAGAKVYVNGNYVGTAPITITVSKNGLKNRQTVVTVKADGYRTQEIILTRRIKISALVGDLLFTGGIGLIIDFIDGAIYKASPGEIKYDLEKQ